MNQTGGACPTGLSTENHSTHQGPPGAGAWGPAGRFNQRLLDPVASLGCTNLTATVAPATAAAFGKAWAAAERVKALGQRWNASVAWPSLVAAVPAELRLAPVSGGRCDRDTSGSTLGSVPFIALSLPFLDLSLPFHRPSSTFRCLSLTFHCLRYSVATGECVRALPTETFRPAVSLLQHP